MRRVPALLLAAGALCCAAPDRSDLPRDSPQAVPRGECNHRWTLPAKVSAQGDIQSLPYEPASTCTGAARPGTVELASHLMSELGSDAVGVGLYDCRLVEGSSTVMSVHAEGRAIDLDLRPDTSAWGDANNVVGDPVANWLVENAETLGVQGVVWDRTRWRADAAIPKDMCSTGVNPHHDHIHIELTSDGADGLTPWFQGAPTTPLDGIRDGDDVVVIDDDDLLNDVADHYTEVGLDFRASNKVSGAFGYGYQVAQVSPGAEPTSFWFLEDAPACYRVDAWWTDSHDRAPDATFAAIDAAGLELGRASVDQAIHGDIWNPLGTWRFSAGWNRIDLLRDGTLGTWVVADAIRLVPDEACGAVCGDGLMEDAETCDDGDVLDGDGCSATCRVEPLGLDDVDPARAGLPASLVARSVVPGATAWFLASGQLGRTSVPGCLQLTAPVASPVLLGSATANTSGQATLTVDVPASLAGRSAAIVAVDLDGCRISPAVVETF